MHRGKQARCCPVDKETNDKNALEAAIKSLMAQEPVTLPETESIANYLLHTVERYKEGNFSPNQQLIAAAEQHVRNLFNRYTKEVIDGALRYFIDQNVTTRENGQVVYDAITLILHIPAKTLDKADATLKKKAEDKKNSLDAQYPLQPTRIRVLKIAEAASEYIETNPLTSDARAAQSLMDILINTFEQKGTLDNGEVNL
jgi:hypothetical protein